MKPLRARIPFAFAILLLAPAPAGSAEKPAPKPGDLLLLLAPRFMSHDAAKPIPRSGAAGPGATEIVPARIGLFGPEVLEPADLAALGFGWDEFQRRAAATGDLVLEILTTEIAKDARGIPTHAILRGEGSMAVASVFAAGFLARFKDSLGDRLLVAAPDRDTLYVFPRAMPTFREFGKSIASQFEDALYPASIELLEIDSNGLRAAGSFLLLQENPQKFLTEDP
ncbi:hypothetical protein BH23VER1_BH23VER1_23500 [soil metagenome]